MKTHQELGITFAEYGALLGTRAMLVEEVLRFTPEKVTVPNIHAFNMGIACIGHSCGSVSCIGGTMGLIMGKGRDGADAYTYEHGYHTLGPLFFPGRDRSTVGYDVDYNVITPAQAVAAIDNFLNTGKPNWGAVLGLTTNEGDDA